jgi:hypothetical protein
MRIFQGIYNKILKKLKHQPRALPIVLFCYHKGGTVLLQKVFKQISEANNWNYLVRGGKQTQLPRNIDVVLLIHSLIDISNIVKPFIGAHVIRDPRDIVVSGYLYHCRCSEEWCVNSDFNPRQPIRFPRVPYSQEHRSEEWKMRYLESLGGMSYQENLLKMSQRDGMLFEMKHYGAWTIESMRDWNYNKDNILEVKFEDLMENYDDTFRLIFDHLGFSKSKIDLGLSIASKHDLGRKKTKEIEKDEHIFSRDTNKWKNYFEAVHKEVFIKYFGNVLIELGYESDNNW